MSSRPFLGLLAIAVLAGCAVPSPHAAPAQSLASGEAGRGRVFHIAPDGSDDGDGSVDAPWRTFLHASASLRPGDALLARGGRYVGQGGPGWTASGDPTAPILFAGYPGEVPIFDGEGVGSFLILDGVSHLEIRDLTITGYAPLDTGVIVVTGASRGVTLERLTMTGNRRDAPAGRWTEHLIYPGEGPVSDLTIRGCQLDAAGLQGGAIHIYHDPGPRGLVIEGNTITNAHWGVLVDSDATGVVITDNVMEGNDLDVAVLDDRADVRVDAEDGEA